MDGQCFALLIDADNVSAKYIKPILTELSKYGIITYKRIYGDWTSTQHSSWKDELLTNSITPIQQFSYTQGKNSTDSAMIIDAMDILYTNDVDGFCIVSSDSDFTRLVSRLRESGKMVIGMGENKTPEPFRKACDKFTILENLMSEQNPGTSKSETTHDRRSKEKIEDAIIKMIIENQDINKPTGLGEVGSRLVSLYPDFDVRSYGYNMLSKFLEEFTRIQMVKHGNIVSVTLREDQDLKENIDSYVVQIVKKSGRSGVELSTLGNKMYEKYKDFKIRDYGYSQFKKYVKSISHMKLEQDGKRWHHILDPRSGYPLDNELDSVTVISADSLDGDIWTTLLFGLGVEKGCAALRQRQDIDAIFVTKNRDIILSSPQRLRFAPLDSGYRVIDCTA